MRGVQGGRPELPPWLRKPPALAAGSGRVSCERSPCTALLYFGPRGQPRLCPGVLWCSLINSQQQLGAVPSRPVPAPFSWGSWDGSCEGGRWCLLRLCRGCCRLQGHWRKEELRGMVLGPRHITPYCGLQLSSGCTRSLPWGTARGNLSPFRSCIQSTWVFSPFILC